MGKLGRIDSIVKAVKQAYNNGGSHSHSRGPESEEERFRKLLQSKEKVAKLHFYIQDALGGPDATVWEVARSSVTAASATSVGQVRVLDDAITAEPDRTSEKLGRAQGMITFSGVDLNFYFSSGEYGGSTLCVVGQNPVSSKNRELPVVGGTGVFRLARGYCVSNTVTYDPVSNYGILEYTVYVAYRDVIEIDFRACLFIPFDYFIY